MMVRHFAAVPGGTITPKYQLGEDESQILEFLAATLLNGRSAVALVAKSGECVAVLMTTSEFSLLKEVERIAADPVLYGKIQDQSKNIDAGGDIDVFVSTHSAF